MAKQKWRRLSSEEMQAVLFGLSKQEKRVVNNYLQTCPLQYGYHHHYEVVLNSATRWKWETVIIRRLRMGLETMFNNKQLTLEIQ